MSFIPAIPAISVNPEWIIAGVLPALLCASAVSVPRMEFRGDFSAISGLSVALVLLSEVALELRVPAPRARPRPLVRHRARSDHQSH